MALAENPLTAQRRYVDDGMLGNSSVRIP